MTIVYIENVFGSGQIIKVLEDFGDRIVEHILQPGDSARIAVSRFKAIKVNEAMIDAPGGPADIATLQRRCA
jgi:hypothetical protein